MADTREGIVPALAELIALREQVRAWPPARRTVTGAVGPATAVLRGRGMEYAESRPYSAGDEVRHIDWRVTARTGRPHTKLYHAERERLSLLVCDTSPRLYFGTRQRFKSVQAARAAALMAWAAQRAGDRLGALRGTATEAPIAPGRGVPGVLRVLGALARWYAAAPADDEGLLFAVRRARRLVHTGARVLLLADPHSLAEVPDGELAALGMHTDCACVLLCDPLELDPPARRLPFESGRYRVLDLADRALSRRWEERFGGQLAAACERLHRLRIPARTLLSDGEVADLLTLWLPGDRSVA